MSASTRVQAVPRTLAQQLNFLMISLLIIASLVFFLLAHFVLRDRIAGAIAETAMPTLASGRHSGHLQSNDPLQLVLEGRPVMRHASQLMAQKLGQPVDLLEQNDKLYFALRANHQVYFQTYPIDREFMIWLMLSWSITALLLVSAATWFAWRVRKPLQAITQLLNQPNANPDAHPDANLDASIRQSSAEIQTLAAQVIDAFQRERASHVLRKHLLSGFAHDVGTPLMRLKLALEILQTDPELHAQMQSDVEQLTQLRESLLRQIRLGELEAPQLVNFSLWLADYQKKRNDDVIDFIVPTRCTAQIMPLAMQRVLDNLLDNAKSHGRTPIVVELTIVDGGWALSISDAGDGIAMDQLARLAQPFVKGQQSSGHGMGLTIVRQLTEIMKLELQFSTSEQGGLAVRLNPASADASA